MYTTFAENTLPESVNWTVQSLNREQVKILVPSIVFTCLASVVGVVGNGTVILVYWRRFKPSNHCCFILMLASCDIITSAVGMPFLVVDMLHAYTFTDIVACRLLRFLNYLTSCVSILTLFLIALERYRKICQPLARQVTVTMARRLLLAPVVGGFLMAAPSLVIYGHNTIHVGVGNITGVQCFTDDSVKHTSFPAIYNAVLLLIISAIGCGMTLCYAGIVRMRWKRGRNMCTTRCLRPVDPGNPLDPPTSSGDASTGDMVTLNYSSNVSGNDSSADISTESTIKPPYTNKYNDKMLLSVKCDALRTRFIKRSATASAKHINWRERTMIRMTKIFVLVTVVFTVSFIPHLILMVLIFLDGRFLSSMSRHQAALYNVALRSFLINSFANPIVYACMDRQFRKHIVCNTRKPGS